MFVHYLKIAVRQLLKYRTQNLISIVGLGVCLLCFSISLYVGRFILATDSCFENRDRMAELHLTSASGETFAGTPAPLPLRLRQMQWDEVEAMTFVAYPGERSFRIEVDGTAIAEVTLNDTGKNEVYEVEYPIPADLLENKDKIKIRFQANPRQTAGGVFGCRLVRQNAKD